MGIDRLYLNDHSGPGGEDWQLKHDRWQYQEAAMKKNFVLLLSFFISVAAAEGGQPVLNVKAPEFTLIDQYDKPYNIRQGEGGIVVLLASDKEGEPQNALWRTAISERYRDKIFMIGIADVRTVPFFLKSRIINNFRKDTERILLDWTGEVFTNYVLAKHASNIVLIDKKGWVRYVTSGEVTIDARETLFKEIDKLLRD
jgi:hypothetical protein